VTFIKIRSHKRKFSNSDSVEQKNVLLAAFKLRQDVNQFVLLHKFLLDFTIRTNNQIDLFLLINV
jgi:hypothetical protein